MKIEFENTYKKHYIELLPTVSIAKHSKKPTIYLGWIFFSVIINF